MNIKNLTEEHLFAIINIATGGYFNGKWSKDKKEVEVGGYDKRRRVIWIQNTEGYDEYHAFEITSEYGPWSWICEVSLKKTDWERESYWIINGAKSYKVNCVNPAGVIDYCDKNNIDVRNNGDLVSVSQHGRLSVVSKFICPLCDGEGRRIFKNCTPPIDEQCPSCKGKGLMDVITKPT